MISRGIAAAFAPLLSARLPGAEPLCGEEDYEDLRAKLKADEEGLR